MSIEYQIDEKRGNSCTDFSRMLWIDQIYCFEIKDASPYIEMTATIQGHLLLTDTNQGHDMDKWLHP